MLTFFAVFIGCLMVIMLIKAVTAKTVYEKILSVNIFGVMTSIVILFISFMRGDMEFIDIALIYAMVNFTTTMAFLKYFRYRAL